VGEEGDVRADKLRLGYAIHWLALAFIRASLYFRFEAVRDLGLPPEMALDSKAMRRLQHYFYGTTFLSIVFGLMHGRRRSAAEKYLFSNLAALSYYFDDLADAYRHENKAEHTWLNNPETYASHADARGVSLHLLQNLYRHLPAAHLQEFKGYLHRVFNVETAGRQQIDHTLDLEALWAITREKGGASVLLFRRILHVPMSKTECDALFAFGGLIQLCDDVSDIWFDHRNGTRTVPLLFALQHNLAGLRQFFDAEVRRVQALFDAVDKKSANFWGGPASAWAAVGILVAIARVCLDAYDQLQEKNGTLPLHDRKAMVVDMERWPNRLRLIQCLSRG